MKRFQIALLLSFIVILFYAPNFFTRMGSIDDTEILSTLAKYKLEGKWALIHSYAQSFNERLIENPYFRPVYYYLRGGEIAWFELNPLAWSFSRACLLIFSVVFLFLGLSSKISIFSSAVLAVSLLGSPSYEAFLLFGPSESYGIFFVALGIYLILSSEKKIGFYTNLGVFFLSTSGLCKVSFVPIGVLSLAWFLWHNVKEIGKISKSNLLLLVINSFIVLIQVAVNLLIYFSQTAHDHMSGYNSTTLFASTLKYGLYYLPWLVGIMVCVGVYFFKSKKWTAHGLIIAFAAILLILSHFAIYRQIPWNGRYLAIPHLTFIFIFFGIIYKTPYLEKIIIRFILFWLFYTIPFSTLKTVESVVESFEFDESVLRLIEGRELSRSVIFEVDDPTDWEKVISVLGRFHFYSKKDVNEHHREAKQEAPRFCVKTHEIQDFTILNQGSWKELVDWSHHGRGKDIAPLQECLMNAESCISLVLGRNNIKAHCQKIFQLRSKKDIRLDFFNRINITPQL